MIGRRLGPYEVTGKLGEGGMGEVYRATDSKLKREVAIKVLPPAFVEDPERLARFEREAQLLAQLHHPNIASIHGLEESEGTLALVMELVEGPTLAERLDAGALPMDEILQIARQIAEALEAAHEKGIIHRDLKPQNVKAPVDGTIKILDFGLAKAMAPDAGNADSPSASQIGASPTLTMRATVQGMILGTAAYMAPEQAAGSAVDRRADIWSFGVVLYEMLVGRRLFDGETVSHVLASVLKDEPDFALLPDDLSPRVRRLVMRCLRKKPRERLQSIGDARVLIEEALAGQDRDEVSVHEPPTPERTTSRWGLAAIAGAALTVGILAGAFFLAPQTPSPDPVRLELAVPAATRVATHQGHMAVALSPNGRLAVLATIDSEGRSALTVRDFGQLAPRNLDGTEGGRAPFLSPDGEWLGFFNQDAMLKVAIAGGRPIRLADADERSRGAVWAPDGYIYFVPDTFSGVRRISEAGGIIEPVTKLNTARDERTHRWPDLSPDGKVLVYTSDTQASPTYYDDARIEAVRIGDGDGEPHVLVEGASMARWLADDLLVYANAGNLFALEIDRKALAPRRKPVALEQELATDVGSGAVNFAVSHGGAAVWLSGNLYGSVGTPLWYERDGTTSEASISDDMIFWQIALSPDGEHVALRTGGVAATDGGQGPAGQDIWVADLSRGTLSRLTFEGSADHPVWTPDGRRIAYSRATADRVDGGREVVWKAADGTGSPEVLLTGINVVNPMAFSPDGREIILGRWTDETKSDLWILPLGQPDAAHEFLATPFDEFSAAVSPDSRFIAYVSDESGEYEVYVRPYPEGTGKWQISQNGGFEPRWSPADNELFYRTGDGRMASAAFKTEPTFTVETPVVLWPQAELLGGRNPKSYGVSPDGKRFLAMRLFIETSIGTPVVNYSDDWLTRARFLLARNN